MALESHLLKRKIWNGRVYVKSKIKKRSTIIGSERRIIDFLARL